MKANNGFIYPLFDSMIRFLFYCNLVELFKFLAKFCTGVLYKKQEKDLSIQEIISCSNIAIDVYQVFKWGILITFWICKFDSIIAKLFIYYFLYSNLFTYFYYHVWGSKYNQRTDKDTIKRKFLNSLLAISYYLFCYAYLYQVHYPEMIVWPGSIIDFTNSLYLSVANAFTLTYGGFSPLTQSIRVIFLTELINTFLFFTIIITNSIPNCSGSQT